jgi:hypothetical protein
MWMKRERNLNVNENLRQYYEQAGLTHPRKNHIVLSSANHTIHELAKCVICWKGQIGLEKELTKDELAMLSLLSSYIEYDRGSVRKKELVPDTFITEAIEYNTKKRRDIVFLNKNEKIEIVNKHISKEIISEYEKDGVLVVNLNNPKNNNE